MNLNVPQKWTDFVTLLVLGVIGGFVALWIGLPLPFMMGSLLLCAAYTIYRSQTGYEVQAPRNFRHYAVGLIGAMIGGRFTPEVPALALALWPSFLTVLVFVALSFGFGYWAFVRLGGYDRQTAMYSAMPGGLIEAISMGEKSGADVRVLAVQHFARVTLVVIVVPLAFLWIGGEAVGSSAGETLQTGVSVWFDYLVIFAAAAVGMWGGRKLKIPAGPLVGPLVICAVLQVTGLVDLHSPGWLMNLAQLVVGAGLGSQFSGLTTRMLLRSFSLGAIVVAGMLVIGAALAAGLSQIVPGGFEALFISFAPGGMTEMALIALSLDASPVIVTAHHLVRILFTVFFMGLWVKFIGGGGGDDEP